jgi:hypothetical protein
MKNESMDKLMAYSKLAFEGGGEQRIISQHQKGKLTAANV